MTYILQPWQLLLFVLAGYVNRHQQQVNDLYQHQLKVLLEAQGKKRILLTDDQRRQLAVKAKLLGRKALLELTTIVTPVTLLRWHRELVAQKWDHSDRRKKKPVDSGSAELAFFRPSFFSDATLGRILGKPFDVGQALSNRI